MREITVDGSPYAVAPVGITAGPDGALWFVEIGAGQVGRITTGGEVTEFPLPDRTARPHAIAGSPDGACWFTEWGGNRVGRITPDGRITEYDLPTPSSEPHGLAVGPDGAVWAALEIGALARISFNQPIIDEFRANHGKVGGWFEGADLILLTTVGARSGREHTSPLAFFRDGDRLLVVGSAGGSDRHPAWYHNVLADPGVRVETGTETYRAEAVPMVGEERRELFERVVAMAPGYGDYQAGTTRPLPVVALSRT
jgi:deazaflavin-dependent oxidoreductase (nitroreductase family)